MFVPSHQHLDKVQEQAIYDLHQNHAEDAGYRRFLNRLAEPLLGRLPEPALGLDYGCGPGPVLAAMLRQAGHVVDVYDPLYFPHTVFRRQGYDFISCSEVVEHFRQPAVDFGRLFGLLKPGAYLALMTKLVKNAEAFKNWHYKNDQSHICFFSTDTMRWLAAYYDCRLEFIGQDVIIFKRGD